MSRLALALAALLCLMLAGRAGAEEKPELRYTPPSQTFACDLPGPEWHAFEEEEAAGFAVHILGPDSETGTFRTGITVRWLEKGQPGWVPLKKHVDDDLRRSDGSTGRVATIVRPYRIPAGLSRIFEVVEKRRLPPDQLPSVEEELHYFYAVLPVGESYYEIKLGSTREEYFGYRDTFVKFLRAFHPIGVAGR